MRTTTQDPNTPSPSTYQKSLIAATWLFCFGLLCATVLAACDRGQTSASMAAPSALSKSLRGASDGEVALSDSTSHWDTRERALSAAQTSDRAISARVHAMTSDAIFDAAWAFDAVSRRKSGR